ncbi:electron transfer flavoprotein subunit beta [Pyrus ussuriensis x Pyrus communis]|uniref:Electron transfer flavoprotein subunit beta n=1 Tax=Pyrus ussuriensis x Pyrus communis TaxID=2448454 RepID=A0A5N5GW79_9ROSA|nr:electron transfer flavoprotein subunit beta [Pyrus ussuriensis x Pyrus communis]
MNSYGQPPAEYTNSNHLHSSVNFVAANWVSLVSDSSQLCYSESFNTSIPQSSVETQNVKMPMNPFCEIAVEEALRIKESGGGVGGGGHLHGTKTIDGPLYPLSIAKLLRPLVKVEKPGLLILGKQAIDDDCNQTGQMVAGLLNWPQGTFASKVVLDKQKQVVTVDREVDGGLETLCLDFPAVIITDLRLNRPRYATIPSIMKAKSKVITKYTPQDLNVEIKSDLEQVQVAEPPTRKAGVLVSSVDVLIDKLKNEAHVI